MKVLITGVVGSHTSAGHLLSAVAIKLAPHHTVRTHVFEPQEPWRRTRFILVALRSNADLVVLRQSLKMIPLIVLVVAFLRFARRRQVVVHIPTPTAAQFAELKDSGWKMPNQALPVVLALDWVLRRTANVVVQNSFEVGRQMPHEVVVANPMLPRPTASPKGQRIDPAGGDVELVGLATNHFSHGYERVLLGLADFLASEPNHGPRKVIIKLVGPADAFSGLVSLSLRLGLTDAVKFLGPLRGEALTEVLMNADAGLGVLALHKVGLRTASALKHKEFLRHGLPYVTSVKEVGFPSDVGWIHTVPPTGGAINFTAFLEWLKDCDRGQMNREVEVLASGPLSPLAPIRAVGAVLKCDGAGSIEESVKR